MDIGLDVTDRIDGRYRVLHPSRPLRSRGEEPGIVGKLINIDNGGTLTDFCVLDGNAMHRTKSLTTPYDLSKCLFDGLGKLAREIYGDAGDVGELLRSTDYIRYSTTQGTNALVERKGPRLGLLHLQPADVEALRTSPARASLFDDLVGERAATIDPELTWEALERNIVQSLNRIVTAGANRVVLSLSSGDCASTETQVCRIIDRKFPSHLLGVVPVLAASELAADDDYARRTWTALLNAFLHPAMEKFLYSAEHRLKAYKTRNPLLIFRNDGGSARVAKTTAIKTYSSGPRGGMEGVRALALHYGFERLLSCDVGGTTTDIGLVAGGELAEESRGDAEGIPLSFPLVKIHSVGVGGSSVIAVNEGCVTVGPGSVGAAPGPACFARGGNKATITDVFLLLGVLDPATYFGGELELDRERAREAVMSTVAKPLGLSLYQALEQMVDSWVGKIAVNVGEFARIDEQTTLAGFGGAGPLAATRIADTLGCRRVIIPGASSVFSAVGIGFSPLSQEYRVALGSTDGTTLDAALKEVRRRASRDLYAEGIDVADCEIEVAVLLDRDGETRVHPVVGVGGAPPDVPASGNATLLYRASKSISAMRFAPVGGEEQHAAAPSDERDLLVGEDEWISVPVYRVEELRPGAVAEGPAIVEDAFFTGRLDPGWRLSMSGNRDLVLERGD